MHDAMHPCAAGGTERRLSYVHSGHRRICECKILGSTQYEKRPGVRFDNFPNAAGANRRNNRITTSPSGGASRGDRTACRSLRLLSTAVVALVGPPAKSAFASLSGAKRTWKSHSFASLPTLVIERNSAPVVMPAAAFHARMTAIEPYLYFEDEPGRRMTMKGLLPLATRPQPASSISRGRSVEAQAFSRFRVARLRSTIRLEVVSAIAASFSSWVSVRETVSIVSPR
jgi:hypothetical protein